MSFFSVWIPRSTTAVALRPSGRFVRCTASASSFRSSVANLLPRSVVTTKFSRQLLADVHHALQVGTAPRVPHVKVVGRPCLLVRQASTSGLNCTQSTLVRCEQSSVIMPSLHLAVPVRFFHFVPAKSCKASLRSSFMSGRLYSLASTESNSCSSSAIGLAHLRLSPCCPTNSQSSCCRPHCPCCLRSPGTGSSGS